MCSLQQQLLKMKNKRALGQNQHYSVAVKKLGLKVSCERGSLWKNMYSFFAVHKQTLHQTIELDTYLTSTIFPQLSEENIIMHDEKCEVLATAAGPLTTLFPIFLV